MHIQFYDFVSMFYELWHFIIHKAHSFVNEFELELHYSNSLYCSSNKQASANL